MFRIAFAAAFALAACLGDTPVASSSPEPEAASDSLEARFASDYDGKFNWLAGAFYMEAESSTQYYVFANGFDYLAATAGPLGEGRDGVGWVAPLFKSETLGYDLTTQALFGEVYYQFVEERDAQ